MRSNPALIPNVHRLWRDYFADSAERHKRRASHHENQLREISDNPYSLGDGFRTIYHFVGKHYNRQMERWQRQEPVKKMLRL